MSENATAAAPGVAAGDAASAIASGTLAAGAVAVVTGAEPAPIGAGADAWDTEEGPYYLATVDFGIDVGDVPSGTEFTVTQVGTPTLATTVVNTPYGFAIQPSATPAANTLYHFTYAS